MPNAGTAPPPTINSVQAPPLPRHSPETGSLPDQPLPKLENLSLGRSVASTSTVSSSSTNGTSISSITANGSASNITSSYPAATSSGLIWPPPSPLGRSVSFKPSAPHSLIPPSPRLSMSNDNFLSFAPEATELKYREPGVYYEGKTRMFILQCKNSTYTFRVDDNKNLEHLYWGRSLPKDDDLSYLTGTHVPGPFDPKGVEDVASRMGLDELSGVEDDEEAVQQWRNMKKVAGGSRKKKGRLENMSWRLWQKMRSDDDNSSLEDSADSLEGLNLSGADKERAKRVLDKTQTFGGDMENESSDGFEDVMDTTIPEGGLVNSGSAMHMKMGSMGGRRSLLKSKEGPGMGLSKLTYNLSVPALSALDEQAGSKAVQPPGSPNLRRTTTLASLSANSLADLQDATNWGQLDPQEVGKNTKLLEWSDRGTGDYREPSFQVKYQDGSSLSPLIYRRHRIIKGKPPMPDACMPHVYLDNPTEASTLEVEMFDPLTSLTIRLYYTVMHDYDAIIRRQVVSNPSGPTVDLQSLMSCTLDFDAEYSFYMTQLSGGWARERQVVTRQLDEGLTVTKSNRGASSHQFNPFIIISPRAPPQEEQGEAFSFQLVYSGNFVAAAEISETRRLRVNMGINPEEFSWALHKHAEFSTPEVVLSYSENGTGPLSRGLHRLYRERLIGRQWRNRGSRPLSRPILLNTWECNYFKVSHDAVVDIAKHAKDAGMEMIVLDDGWYGERNDTFSSLGDWFPDRTKLPFGLEGLVQAVNDVGMRFGIWVEPEMVSKDSRLYNQHPDWCLRVPDRPMTKGRNQLVLDFSRQNVRDYIVNVLDNILNCANIEYVKWDMNRHLTEVFSQGFPAERQGEIAHRYIMGVYDVLNRLVRTHDKVLFETCSGGGGRFDCGMLYFGPQIWASDNTDALSRVGIQYGTSIAYPPCTMGSHVSAVPNHQTLRTSTLKTRSLVAFCGSFGYELDPRILNEKATEDVREFIQIQKWIAPLVYDGDMYRLWDPFATDSGAWMFVSQDKRQAVVTAVNIRRDTGRLLPRLRLKGLDPNIVYEIEELAPGEFVRDVHTAAIHWENVQVYQFPGKPRMSGKTLASAGIPVKFLYDSDSVLFVLHDITGKKVQENEYPIEPVVV